MAIDIKISEKIFDTDWYINSKKVLPLIKISKTGQFFQFVSKAQKNNRAMSYHLVKIVVFFISTLSLSRSGGTLLMDKGL